ncbi:MAG: PHP domain-containing protein [Treponema sp.]|nr:PHP domain-containing protein [Treponema sp.]
MDYLSVINDQNKSSEERLESLRNWRKTGNNNDLSKKNSEVNNHIHTIYSFSPYTPTMAALQAFNCGLCAAGSVDHDSIAAAPELLETCAILGIGGCVGFEVRVSFKNFKDRKMNNPDSRGLVYMTVQGIPKPAISKAEDFLKPIREQRLKRTKAMTVSANVLLKEAGFEEIDFENDIINQSKYLEGGGITERHLLAAAARKIIKKFGKGKQLIEGLNAKMGITIQPKLAALLSDSENPHYLYDLLGVLKTEFLPGIFIQPDENECLPATDVTAFADSIGAIPAYAYLGDVGESPTGDKKTEKFEDDFIEELFNEISSLNYKAITYMPPRNTIEQLQNVQRLCREFNFMEISGVDINNSRQSFNNPEVMKDEFRHLLDTTWALIAHERLASIDKCFGLFSKGNPLESLELKERLIAYATFGKILNLHSPDESAYEITREIQKGRLV